MGRKIGLLACSVLGAGVVLCPPIVEAQQNDQATATAGLEEIVVTARRREEKLQTVPIAIEAFTGDALQEHKVEGLEDLSRLVPAVTQVQTRRNEEGLSIRGLNNSGASAVGQSNSVTTYYAEVPMPTGDSMGSGRYFDLDNAQILQGPQGTLFGRNSTGGALLIQPKRPTNDFEGYAQVQFGNYSEQDYQVAVNVPIVEDVLLVRVAGERESRDGFTHDLTSGQYLDDRDSWSGRASVTFRPTDNFENYFVYDTYYSHTAGTSEVLDYANPNFLISTLVPVKGCATPITLGGSGALPGFNYGLPFCSRILGGRFALFAGNGIANALAQQIALGPRVIFGAIRGLDVSESNGATDVATWDIADSLTLKNIFGYREYKTLERLDGDGLPLPLLDFLNPSGWNTDTSQYSEELQLQGKLLNDSLVWTVGDFALYAHAAGDETNTISALGSTSIANVHPTERSEAVFGQATYNLGDLVTALEGLKLTGGIRYTWDFRRLYDEQTNAKGCLLGTPATGCTIDPAAEFKAPSWTLGLEYQLDPTTLVYVTGRRGYRSGGLNTQSGGVVSPEYQPEHLTDVEIGVKSDWVLMGVEGRTNLAAYHSDFSNAQVSESGTVVLPSGVATPINAIVNAASATIQGWTLDVTLVPVKALQVTGSWAYTDAKYDQVINVFNPNAGAADRPYAFVSRNKFVIDALYTLPLPETIGRVSAGLTWSFSTHQALAVLTDPDGNQSAYRNLNLRLAWNGVLGYPVDAMFFMTNVTDNLYKIGGFPVGTSIGFDSYLWNEPRMFGFSLKYRFGETRS